METLTFQYNGHEATIIKPDTPAEGNPWVWRAEFLGAFDYADKQLLNDGWHIAYYRLCDMYGSPEAVMLMKSFRDFLVRKFSLSKKADIFGFSRGGLYTVNYTLKYPEDISTVYLDAPVLDIYTWPKLSAPSEWQHCIDIYDAENTSSDKLESNPINNLDKLISLGIPIILVAGDADSVVPYKDNGSILAEKLLKSQLRHKVIVKPGVDHHPHSLENPSEIVEFIKENK